MSSQAARINQKMAPKNIKPDKRNKAYFMLPQKMQLKNLRI